MKIYLTRHGKTIWNKEKRMQGWKDSELIDEGISAAKRLGKRLENINFDYILSSPLKRAYNTALIIKGARKIEIIKKDYLKEINLGEWEGKCIHDVEKEFPQEHRNFWNYPDKFTSINGESMFDFMKRIKSGLEDIKKINANNILIVSHAVAVKAVYAIINEYPVSNLWIPPFIQGTSLTIIEYNNDKFKITLEADLSHLEE